MRTLSLKVGLGICLVALLLAAGLAVLRKQEPGAAAGPGRDPLSGVAGGSQGPTALTNGAAALVAGQARRSTNSTLAAKGAARAKPVALTADQKVAERMQERLDQEDEKGALELARQLVKSGESDVRAEVVGVLGWIGVRALPELSQLLGDPDETVANDAYTQWKSALDEVTDDTLKGQLLTAGMSTMQDQGDLEVCVQKFDQLPAEIGIRGLVTLIQSPNVIASETARGHYQFATGEEYTTPVAAEAWILANSAPAPAKPQK